MQPCDCKASARLHAFLCRDTAIAQLWEVEKRDQDSLHTAGHAPAKISLALAVFRLTSTVSGARVNAGAVATMALPLDACRPSVTTTRAPAAWRPPLEMTGPLKLLCV